MHICVRTSKITNLLRNLFVASHGPEFEDEAKRGSFGQFLIRIRIQDMHPIQIRDSNPDSIWIRDPVLFWPLDQEVWYQIYSWSVLAGSGSEMIYSESGSGKKFGIRPDPQHGMYISKYLGLASREVGISCCKQASWWREVTEGNNLRLILGGDAGCCLYKVSSVSNFRIRNIGTLVHLR
jgi:hypothetical protein